MKRSGLASGWSSWSGWLSKSQVIRYLTCPYSWYLEKVLKIKGRRVIELEKGRVLHQVLERVYSMKVKFTDENDLHTTLQNIRGYAEVRKQCDTFSTLVSKYTLKRPLFRELTIVDREEKLRAIIDRVDLLDNRLVVGEYKWSDSWKWSAFELSLYAYLLERKLGKDVNHGIVFYLDSGRVDSITISQKMKDDAIYTVRKVREEIYNSLITSVFPKKKGEWCKTCPYSNDCSL